MSDPTAGGTCNADCQALQITVYGHYMDYGSGAPAASCCLDSGVNFGAIAQNPDFRSWSWPLGIHRLPDYISLSSPLAPNFLTPFAGGTLTIDRNFNFYYSTEVAFSLPLSISMGWIDQGTTPAALTNFLTGPSVSAVGGPVGATVSVQSGVVGYTIGTPSIGGGNSTQFSGN